MQNITTEQSTKASSERRRGYLFPLILVTSLFFFWGFVHNLDPVLIPHLRKAFQLTDLESSLVDFSIFIAYFLMAIPAGNVMRKYGYKSGIIFGLCLFALGAFLFIPAANTQKYIFFLGALFVIACGLAFLETAANPYVTILGPEETATRRLNFSQSFNGLAAFIAPIVGGKYILSEQSLTDAQLKALSPQDLSAYIAQEAASVKGPYLILGVIIVIVMLLFVFTKLPDIKHEDDGDKSKISHAWRHKHLRWAVVAQFFYVGAQVCVLSFFIRFVVVSAGITEKNAAFYSGLAGLAFMVGRFVGTFFMKYVKPNKLLMIYAVLSMLLTLVAVFGKGDITIYALIGVAFFMSIMFPTIFSLGIADLGKDTKIASSLIVMSIVGGAILPLGLGYISDVTHSIQYGYIVPFICFIVVFAFGKYGWKPTEA
ncbi:L-fucose:H+ symporter permease [Elizabethkingia ursingii]|jgi:FHS family L-fucose permease-like MFS transporter|uniref:L-fucose:H+ symporter permease n=1 Tax=Elizabethkingia ursingii TaxID=1756150 RepID=A0AAJ3NE70_9FLAO|nr:L-fucose:H+ symporter permease [Elizabethkingia ursingii]MDR2230660.1 L-fucose:H+ symporter permease [Flavobacteriaceae bacterium]AQX08453.1 L-fucose:H+ symporter permease [Elizabethkingia ursingii]OPB78079.1 L-fucose:H+ symporter permease [Elizabethkingia ursingii]OPB85714.1 L-fucose:H+ symporter permease [Elizabethkingia ursingii]OPC01104.1 L-fucose:H+ symporter permease [Elizabethkingia ursingii]